MIDAVARDDIRWGSHVEKSRSAYFPLALEVLCMVSFSHIFGTVVLSKHFRAVVHWVCNLSAALFILRLMMASRMISCCLRRSKIAKPKQAFIALSKWRTPARGIQLSRQLRIRDSLDFSPHQQLAANFSLKRCAIRSRWATTTKRRI